MNDLGMTFAWCALQVSLLMVPAVALHALASRRGAAAGAWTAAFGLTLSVAITVVAFCPRPRGRPDVSSPSAPVSAADGAGGVSREAKPKAPDRLGANLSTGRGPGVGLSLPVAALRTMLGRIARGTSAPLARVRPWGSLVAAAGLAGAGLGLVRLLLGLWVVQLCRRRGTVVTDPHVKELLEEIRIGISSRREVEIRQVPDLLAPATAGWRHPVVLLPADWPSWDESTRRAVLAHELAHIQRRDYATGFVARLAVSLHFYHPLVYWMAGRLQLQQELAADAVGARFARGRGPYLLALSRLALRQDGQSPCWPARAFLPARGTLIRRIAMLRDDDEVSERPWSRPRRLLVAFCLLSVAAAAMSLRGPARGADHRPSAAARVEPAAAVSEPAPAGPKPIELVYVPENMVGLVAFRPAATFRRTGMAHFATRIQGAAVVAPSDHLSSMKQIAASKPERPILRLEDIEWVTCGINVGRTHHKHPIDKVLHTMELGGLTVRAVRPFDWLAFLRVWGLEFTEVREPGVVYHRITGPLKEVLGPRPGGVFLPDDRTIVFAEEKDIQKLVRKEKPGIPAYLSGPEWDRASRGLLAVAINNQDGAFAKAYDIGRAEPGDAEFLPLFKGVDRWVFGVDDADSIAVHALASCGAVASESIAGTVESLVRLALVTLERESPEHPGPDDLLGGFYDRSIQMASSLLANLRVGRSNGSVELQSAGFGSLAELGALIEGDIEHELALSQKRKARTK